MTANSIQNSGNPEKTPDSDSHQPEVSWEEPPTSPDKPKVDPVTSTLAAVAGGGIAGAAIGRMVGGRVGATIGAVVGGVAGVAIQNDAVKEEVSHTVSHTLEVAADRVKDVVESATPNASDRDNFDLTPSEPIQSEPIQSEPTLVENQPDQTVAEAQSIQEATLATSQPDPELLAKTHYQLGVTLGRQGELDEAIEEFQEALDFVPDSAETHYNLGVAYSKQGDVEQALEHMQQAKDLCEAQGKVQGIQAVEQTIEVIETEPT